MSSTNDTSGNSSQTTESSSSPASPTSFSRNSPSPQTSSRSMTPPTTQHATASVITAVPRNRSTPVLNQSTVVVSASQGGRRNGEPAAKVLRTLGVQPSSSREMKPPPRLFSEDDSQYERAIKAIFQYERKDGEEIIFPIADTPEKAAYLSRLDPNNLSEREERDFSEIAHGAASLKELHLLLRNTALQLWLRNPRRHLVVRTVLTHLSEQHSNLGYDQEHLIRIMKSLNRNCLINYGDFSMERPAPTGRQQWHVVVIGAGLAGLAAARQLRHFGFRVTVLEARARPGGRVDSWCSSTNKTHLAEKGAMLVTGTEGNPIFTMLHGQLGMKLENVDVRCPIFESNGSPVSQDRDEILESEFEDLVFAAPAYYKNHVTNRNADGRVLGVGNCVEEVLKMKELEVMVKDNQAIENRCKNVRQLRELYFSRTRLYYLAKTCYADFNKALLQSQLHMDGVSRETVLHCKNRLSRINSEVQDVEVQIQVLEALPEPQSTVDESHCYITEADRKVLYWHMANYDFANAVPIEDLSVEHWDQDEEFELKGGHYSVPGGLSQLTERLAAGLNINFNHRVTEISYDRSGVKISAKCSYSTTLKEFPCDVVISTLPLGVLKHAESERTGLFCPPLPDSKADSIKRLSSGMLNKVILTYNRKFWKARRTLFGYANGTPEKRGEFFMFWALYDQPILVAFIAGKAAEILEEVDESVIVQSCTVVLQRIFGKNVVTSPKEFVVTRWGSDEFSLGSYCSVPVGASGGDFDVLAEAVEVEEIPRVCFAGEHTIRRYPGTMHGAFLSGLREATRVADYYNGTDNIY